MTQRRPNRIPKTLARKLADVEDHLYLLRGHLHGLKDDPAHIKARAAELRTLICRSSGTEGLLWRLVDHYGVSDAVHLHVAGRVNPDHPLARGLSFAVAIIQRPTPALEPKLSSAIYSFKEIIKEYEAVWTLGMKRYTHEQLIKAVAEEVGSVLFSVTKRGTTPLNLATPIPESWAAGQDAVFCLCYEHNKKRLHALSPGLTGDAIEGCDLGFLEADLRPEMSGTAKPYVEMVAAYVHIRVFSPEEVAHIHEILIEPPRIEEL